MPFGQNHMPYATKVLVNLAVVLISFSFLVRTPKFSPAISIMFEYSVVGLGLGAPWSNIHRFCWYTWGKGMGMVCEPHVERTAALNATG